jgi:O-antigen/teichoic acid export membrane protein
MVTTATMALSGLAFWLIAAHLYGAHRVGQATPFVTAMTTLPYVSGLGLTGTLVRYLPTSRSQEADVGSGVALVGIVGLIAGVGYWLLLPITAPSLTSVASSPWELLAFAVFTSATTVVLLTESVFVAFRAARFNLLINGILTGLLKIGLPLVLVGLGAFGIVASIGIAAVVAAVTSVVIFQRAVGVRPRLVPRLGILRRTAGYSSASYVTTGLSLVPVLAIPPVILDRLGPEPLAGYFVSFQIATLVYSVAYAISEVAVAEGSRPQARLSRVAGRAGLVIGLLTVPAVLVMVFLSRWVLLLFGTAYAKTAGPTLVVLALGAFAVAFNAWANILVRVTRNLAAMVSSTVVLVGVIMVLVLDWAGRGTIWVAWAWTLGNLACGVVAVAGFLWRRARPRPSGGGVRPAERSLDTPPAGSAIPAPEWS